MLDGHLIAGFPEAGDPLALSRATIYVPTQRAAAGLSQALLAASGRPTLILPRIAPLGAFEVEVNSRNCLAILVSIRRLRTFRPRSANSPAA